MTDYVDVKSRTKDLAVKIDNRINSEGGKGVGADVGGRPLRIYKVHSLNNQEGVVNITQDGTNHFPANHLGSYSPQVGDGVIAIKNGSDWLVLGSRKRGQNIPPPRDFTTNPITDEEIADGVIPPHRDFILDPIKLDELANNSVNVSKIIDGAVSRVKIAEAAINAALIDMGAVTETKIGPNAVTTPKIAANSIIADHLQTRIIETNHIVAGAITAYEIASRTITADRIALNSLTANEIATGSIIIGPVGTGSPIQYASGYDPSTKATPEYVQSRGENLITNGTGLLENNTNFSSFVYDPTQRYSGGGSFRRTSLATTSFSDEYIPVDPNRPYRIGSMIKGGELTSRFYIGAACYDADRNSISNPHVQYTAGTTTVLTQPFGPNDTVMHVQSVANWRPPGGGHFCGVAFYPYTNAQGYTYPEYTYTRHASSGTYDTGSINSTNNTITFPSTLAAHHFKNGQAWPAGTPVANAHSGASYEYVAASNLWTTQEWEGYFGVMRGLADPGTVNTIRFRQGTAFIRVLFLLNREGASGTKTTWIDGVVAELEYETTAGSQTRVDTAVSPINTRITLWQYANTTFIDGGNIYTNTITANQIAAGTITAASGILADLSVTNAKIVDLAVTNAKIADLAVTEAKIANLAVTNAKINSLSASKIDAGTITSALIQLGTGGILRAGTTTNGLQVDASGIRQFSGGSTTVDIPSNGGTATFSGNIVAGGQIQINNNGIVLPAGLGLINTIAWRDTSNNLFGRLFSNSTNMQVSHPNRVSLIGTSGISLLTSSGDISLSHSSTSGVNVGVQGDASSTNGTMNIGTINTSSRLNVGGDSGNQSNTSSRVVIDGSGFILANRSGAAAATLGRTANGVVVDFRRGGADVGHIAVTETGTSYNSGSDYRLKQDINDFYGGREIIKMLRPRTFRWKSNPEGGWEVGFIAHEVQEVAPRAVTGSKDGEEMQGLDPSKLVGFITAATKELIYENEELREQLETLSDRVATLEESAA